ncbi:MAG: diaminopimelate epimerase [Atribacterota bacterium]|mgnify:CR=1 FL=1
MRIYFVKMNGYGNDFIIIDNRNKIIPERNISEMAKKICKRRESLGADGLLLLEDSLLYDFKMRLFNPDGSEGEMCGNGARCIAEYAFIEGIANQEMTFETLAGKISAKVNDDNVMIQMPDVSINNMIRNKIITIDEQDFIYTYLFIGVPHCVIFLKENILESNLYNLGKKIRFEKNYFPAGTNVNFVKFKEGNQLFVRTYERGVEEITLSCGTGSLASAIVYSVNEKKHPPFIVKTKGGDLVVDFVKEKKIIKNITLTGKVKMVARGEMLPQSYSDN